MGSVTYASAAQACAAFVKDKGKGVSGGTASHGSQGDIRCTYKLGRRGPATGESGSLRAMLQSDPGDRDSPARGKTLMVEAASAANLKVEWLVSGYPDRRGTPPPDGFDVRAAAEKHPSVQWDELGAELREIYARHLALLDPEIRSELGLGGILEVPAFYSAYYWAVTLAKRFQEQHGADAGVEQELLERAPVEVDWDVVERVKQSAEQQTT